HRRAEVSREEAAHPVPELVPQRLVETEARTLGGDRRRVDATALGEPAQLDDVARHHAQHDEDEHRDACQRRDHEEQPMDGVAQHGRARKSARPGSRALFAYLRYWSSHTSVRSWLR